MGVDLGDREDMGLLLETSDGPPLDGGQRSQENGPFNSFRRPFDQ